MNAPASAATCGELPRVRRIHGSTNMNWPCTAAVRLLALIIASVRRGVVRLRSKALSRSGIGPGSERRGGGCRPCERESRIPRRLEVDAVHDRKPHACEIVRDRTARVGVDEEEGSG